MSWTRWSVTRAVRAWAAARSNSGSFPAEDAWCSPRRWSSDRDYTRPSSGCCRGTLSSVRVSVRSQGGVFGVTRTVLIADGAVDVTEKGVSRAVGHLDEATAARVRELATLVSKQQI